MNTDRTILNQILGKARDAAVGGLGAMSLGEKLAVALVLNRADWLADLNYTIPEALARIGPAWIAHIPAAARQLEQEAAVVAEGLQRASYCAAVQSFFTGDEIALNSKLVTHTMPNGYRDVTLYFDVEQRYADGPDLKSRIALTVRPEDGEGVVRAILDAHRSTWSTGRTPIDIKDGETRPAWIDRL